MEGSEGLDEEIGFLLNEDMILLTFPFSAVVPAALEARNKLLLGTESEAGTCVLSACSGCVRPAGLHRVGGGLPGALEIIAKNPKQQGSDPQSEGHTAGGAEPADIGIWRLVRLLGDGSSEGCI